MRSEAVFREGSLHCRDVLGSFSLLSSVDLLLFQFVEFLRFLLPAVFQARDGVLALPAGELGNVAEDAEFAEVLEAQGLEGAGNNHALLVIVGVGDALEHLQAAKSLGTSAGLVFEHAADSLEEHAGRGAEVEAATATGVGVPSVLEVFLVLGLVPEERAGLQDGFGPHDDDLLAVEQLFGDNRGEAAQHVSARVDDQLLIKHS